ncbi:MAG TPA: flagellar filament capping protein FliD [Rhodocyclaceae bacterium]|nr:flagellar filament capping protein FliD [Rhodocyclaceae bacterium]
MDSSLAIPQVSLTGLSGINPVTLELLTAGVTSDGTSLLFTPSSIVQLSSLGQVLSAGSSLAKSIQALQASNPSNATPGSVQTEAQNFVDAFNQVETSIGNAQPLLGTSSGDSLVNVFSQTLNATASLPPATGSVNLSSLQSIGISVQTSLSPSTAEPAVRLNVDQNALNAAATANPSGTLTLLNQATEPLLQQVTAFETQAAESPSDLIALGNDTDPLNNLLFTAGQDNTQLIAPDLAAASVATSATEPASTLDSISPPTSQTATTGLNQTTSAGTIHDDGISASAANTVSIPIITATTSTPSVASATTVDTTIANQNTVASPAEPTVTTTDQADAATSALLQNLEQDPTQSNILFNPFYAASIAAYRQNDIMPPALINPNAFVVDIPAPVMPITSAKRISDYA